VDLSGLEEELKEYENHEVRRAGVEPLRAALDGCVLPSVGRRHSQPAARRVSALSVRPLPRPQVVRDILRSGHGSELRERVAAVENRLHQVRSPLSSPRPCPMRGELSLPAVAAGAGLYPGLCGGERQPGGAARANKGV
jgi:hypothetical protein